ncbi:Phage Mu protein F like protein [Paracoccus haematequi]|uniref:Phage Mu protein F like protein n=1 Tax=Paracoccus haematequi TaxID=2491866 RepID=A0A447IMY0_9RHOB|nr:phage minor head protein [Paracoccus haematequi]VDS08875.1 Phage Mu protein F like protein [Paracoccus haematequi]
MARNPTRTQIAAIETLLAGAEQQIRDAFLAAIYAARGRVDLGALVDALERRDMAAAMEMLRFDQSLLWPLEEAVRGTFLTGGAMVGEALPQGLQGRFGFNGRHPRAETLIRNQGAALVQVIEREQTEAMRLVLTDAMEKNRPARQAALDITGRMNRVTKRREGGSVGLTAETADHLINARATLSDPARLREYFVVDRATGKRKPRYALSDARYLPRVAKAIKEGRRLAAADIEQMMTSHKNRALAYRGRVISQNEAFTAQAAGRHEAYSQMLENPDIEAVSVRWQHSPQREPRPDHRAMDGTKVNLGEDFEFPDGTRMAYPHDPRGGAKHSIGCKCVAIYRLIYRRD